MLLYLGFAEGIKCNVGGTATNTFESNGYSQKDRYIHLGSWVVDGTECELYPLTGDIEHTENDILGYCCPDNLSSILPITGYVADGDYNQIGSSYIVSETSGDIENFDIVTGYTHDTSEKWFRITQDSETSDTPIKCITGATVSDFIINAKNVKTYYDQKLTILNTSKALICTNGGTFFYSTPISKMNYTSIIVESLKNSPDVYKILQEYPDDLITAYIKYTTSNFIDCCYINYSGRYRYRFSKRCK